MLPQEGKILPSVPKENLWHVQTPSANQQTPCQPRKCQTKFNKHIQEISSKIYTGILQTGLNGMSKVTHFTGNCKRFTVAPGETSERETASCPQRSIPPSSRSSQRVSETTLPHRWQSGAAMWLSPSQRDGSGREPAASCWPRQAPGLLLQAPPPLGRLKAGIG